MARVRDYKAEYARRIAGGMSKGLTRGQARGHPEVSKVFTSVQQSASKYNDKLEEGLKLVKNGQPLSSASKSIHVSAERLRNYVIGQGVGEKVSGRWKIGTDNRMREIEIISGGKVHTIRVKDYTTAKLIGEYRNAVKQFLDTNDPSHIDTYRGISIADVKGKRYVFETDENVLYKLHSTGDDNFQNIYKIVA